MYQNRDDIRQVYLTVWNKLQQGTLLDAMEGVIAQVIELHPEYHAFLAQGEDAKQADFSPEFGQSNPFLHMGMHIALQEQTSTDRPAGIREIHQTLCASLGRHDAEHAMMECLGEALWRAQSQQTAPDEIAYLACLKRIKA